MLDITIDVLVDEAELKVSGDFDNQIASVELTHFIKDEEESRPLNAVYKTGSQTTVTLTPDELKDMFKAIGYVLMQFDQARD